MSFEEQKWRRMNKTRDFICNFGDKERVRETRLSVQINSLSLSLSGHTSRHLLIYQQNFATVSPDEW
jgi:hypothetical protein